MCNTFNLALFQFALVWTVDRKSRQAGRPMFFCAMHTYPGMSEAPSDIRDKMLVCPVHFEDLRIKRRSMQGGHAHKFTTVSDMSTSYRKLSISNVW